MVNITEAISEIREFVTSLSSSHPITARSVHEYLSECEKIITLRAQLDGDLKKGLSPILEEVESSLMNVNSTITKLFEQKHSYNQLLEFDLPKVAKLVNTCILEIQSIIKEYSNIEEKRSREWLYERASRMLSTVGQILGESNTFVTRVNSLIRKSTSLSAEFSNIYSDLMNLYESKTIDIPKSVNLDDIDLCVSDLEDLGVRVELDKKGNSYVMILNRWDSRVSKIVDKYIK